MVANWKDIRETLKRPILLTSELTLSKINFSLSIDAAITCKETPIETQLIETLSKASYQVSSILAHIV